MSDRDSRTEAGQDEEGKVITLGWPVVLLPVVAILVVVLGFIAGKTLSGSSSSAAPNEPVAVSGAQVPVPGQGGQVPSEGSNVIQLPPSQPQSLFDSDEVVDLPQRFHPLLNQPVPDFAMTQMDTGETVNMSDFKGQPVMVNFWATWCPPCRFEMPWIQSVYEDNKDSGFVVLGVNAGERVPPSMLTDTVAQFISSMGLTFPMLVGDNTFQVQRSWSVSGLPATFFVDGEGLVVDVHQGMFPNLATLEDKVSKVLE